MSWASLPYFYFPKFKNNSLAAIWSNSLQAGGKLEPILAQTVNSGLPLVILGHLHPLCTPCTPLHHCHPLPSHLVAMPWPCHAHLATPHARPAPLPSHPGSPCHIASNRSPEPASAFPEPRSSLHDPATHASMPPARSIVCTDAAQTPTLPVDRDLSLPPLLFRLNRH